MCAYPHSDHALPHWKCILLFCADCPCINLSDQETNKKDEEKHPQSGFTFIKSLDVVMLMVEFH